MEKRVNASQEMGDRQGCRGEEEAVEKKKKRGKWKSRGEMEAVNGSVKETRWSEVLKEDCKTWNQQ